MNISALTGTPPVTAVVTMRRSTDGADAAAAPAPVSAAALHAPDAQLMRRARDAAQQIETFVRSHGRNLEFRIDDSTGVVVVRVRDADTGELIRQIPSEAALRFAARLANAAADGDPASVMLDEMV